MRIAHVVTYISDDGAYGGPARVARTQAVALGARGIDVEIYAAAPITATTVREGHGVTTRLFPAHRVSSHLGFAGTYGSGLNRELRRRMREYDAVHVHLARDLVTLPAAKAAIGAGVPVIAQPHGMIDPPTNVLAVPLDRFWMKPVLRRTYRVLALTEREEADVIEVAGSVNIERIMNGVQIVAVPSYTGRRRQVLFLARLHPRKRPLEFVAMAEQVAASHPDVNFVLAGPDEGEGKAVRRAIAASPFRQQISWVGPVNPADTEELLRDSKVYVLPSVGEVFPMSLIEAFRAGTPSVATSSLGIAELCENYGAAAITDGSVPALAKAVREVLDNEAFAYALRQGAERMMRDELDINRVVDQLVNLYARARCGA